MVYPVVLICINASYDGNINGNINGNISPVMPGLRLMGDHWNAAPDPGIP